MKLLKRVVVYEAIYGRKDACSEWKIYISI